MPRGNDNQNNSHGERSCARQAGLTNICSKVHIRLATTAILSSKTRVAIRVVADEGIVVSSHPKSKLEDGIEV